MMSSRISMKLERCEINNMNILGGGSFTDLRRVFFVTSALGPLQGAIEVLSNDGPNPRVVLETGGIGGEDDFGIIRGQSLTPIRSTDLGRFWVVANNIIRIAPVRSSIEFFNIVTVDSTQSIFQQNNLFFEIGNQVTSTAFELRGTTNMANALRVIVQDINQV